MLRSSGDDASKGRGFRRFFAILAVVGAVVAFVSWRVIPAGADHLALDSARLQGPTKVTVSSAEAPGSFGGIGAISGGGGNSRFLDDYPPAEQQQVYRLLFGSGGADLSILKLEIGGGANTSAGSEPSVEPEPGKVNCTSGYEWAIAKAAVALNPAIQLYGLQWSAPGWISGSSHTIWTRADVSYVLTWLGCATRQGLHISYLGGWNEEASDKTAEAKWFVELRQALDAHGYSYIKLVANDSAIPRHKPDISSQLMKDSAFRNAVSVVGVHDPCQFPTTGRHCKAPRDMAALHLPLWESEIGDMPSYKGAPVMARVINRSYIQGGYTRFIEWPLMDAIPASGPFEGRGLVWANWPWAGYFRVTPILWVIAQTNQFVKPGWLYVAGGARYLNDGGSLVTYRQSSGRNWSMVAETTTAHRPQKLMVHITGGMSRGMVQIWATNLKSHQQSAWFVHEADLSPHDGRLSLSLQPGFVYTLTTTTGQHKGATSSGRAPSSMPLPYHASCDASGEPRYLAPQDGSFACQANGSFEQTTDTTPVTWRKPRGSQYPFALIGSKAWHNYAISVMVHFSGANQSAGLFGRCRRGGGAGGNPMASHFECYHFTVDQDGSWQLKKSEDTKSGAAQFVSMAQAAAHSETRLLATSRWHYLKLVFMGQTVMAQLDGHVVARLRDDSSSHGVAGVSTGGFYGVDYKGLTITQAP